MKAFTESSTETVVILDTPEVEEMRTVCRTLVKLPQIPRHTEDFAVNLLCSLTPACLNAQTQKGNDQ